jgi:hypothetical protein
VAVEQPYPRVWRHGKAFGEKAADHHVQITTGEQKELLFNQLCKGKTNEERALSNSLRLPSLGGCPVASTLRQESISVYEEYDLWDMELGPLGDVQVSPSRICCMPEERSKKTRRTTKARGHICFNG